MLFCAGQLWAEGPIVGERPGRRLGSLGPETTAISHQFGHGHRISPHNRKGWMGLANVPEASRHQRRAVGDEMFK